MENLTLLVNIDTLYVHMYIRGDGIWGISFLGMSIPRKAFLLYNFRRWNNVIKKRKNREKV